MRTEKRRVHLASIAIAILIAQTVATAAADIKVLSSIGLKEVMGEAGPAFERVSGHKLSISYDVAAALKRRIEGGETFDVAILSDTAVSDLMKQGRIVGGTEADIARTGIGLAIRAGAARPNIGTTEAFKQTLLSAKSIGSSKEGWSGVIFEKIIQRLGIADEVKPKIKFVTSGYVAEIVANGDAELAVHLVSEILPVRGAELLGPFPADVQAYFVLTAGLSSAPLEAGAAKELINFLKSPAAVPVVKAKGMEPG